MLLAMVGADLSSTSRGRPRSFDLHRLAAQRLGGKKQISSVNRIDFVHRRLILQQDVLYNKMYLDIAAGNLDAPGLRLFLSEYYHGLVKGFTTIVLVKGLRAFQHPLWVAFIRDIIREEMTPRPHHDLFLDLMKSSGIELAAPHHAAELVRNMIVGYTNDLNYSVGYALSLEVQADYDIGIVEQLLCSLINPAVIQNSLWCKIHLDASGEELHACMATTLAERLVVSDHDYKQFVDGFIAGCSDVEVFMTSVHTHIFQAEEGNTA